VDPNRERLASFEKQLAAVKISVQDTMKKILSPVDLLQGTPTNPISL
jgi:hypothetical protein